MLSNAPPVVPTSQGPHLPSMFPRVLFATSSFLYASGCAPGGLPTAGVALLGGMVAV